jgi:hypothetical protein
MSARPRPSRRIAAGLLAAALVLGPGPAVADPLVIDADGTVRIGPPSGEALAVERELVRIGKPVSFGRRLAALMTLWEQGYTIGIQPSTMYFRTARNVAWYQGGDHESTELAAGSGGQMLMALSSAPGAGKGTLHVEGGISGTALDVSGTVAGAAVNASGAISGESLGVRAGITGKALDLRLNDRTNPENHPATLGDSLYVTGDISDFRPADGSGNARIEFRHSNGSQGIGLGYNTIYATGSNANQPLRLQARGTSNVAIAGNGNLEVPGRLYLGNGWNIATTATSMHFRKGEQLVMAINSNERLQYDVPGIGFYYLGRQPDIVSSNNAVWQSDARLKQEVAAIPGALGKLRALRGVSFRWNADGIARLSADLPPPGPARTALEAEFRRPNLGVIAQEVEAVLPQAVRVDADGIRSVQYRDLIPLLIEAVKEQDAIVAAQAAQLAAQAARLAAVEAELDQLAARTTPAALSAP